MPKRTCRKERKECKKCRPDRRSPCRRSSFVFFAFPSAFLRTCFVVNLLLHVTSRGQEPAPEDRRSVLWSLRHRPFGRESHHGAAHGAGRYHRSAHRRSEGALRARRIDSHSRAVPSAPPCAYAGVCGGCSWQHLRYDAQLQAKERSVADALRRIGKLDGYELRPIIASARELGYRRRIRLQVGPDKQLGFFGAGSHRLVEIDSCLIAGEPLNELLDSLRRWARGLETAIDYIEFVAGDGPGELIAVVQASGDLAPRDERRCEELIADAA